MQIIAIAIFMISPLILLKGANERSARRLDAVDCVRSSETLAQAKNCVTELTNSCISPMSHPVNE